MLYDPSGASTAFSSTLIFGVDPFAASSLQSVFAPGGAPFGQARSIQNYKIEVVGPQNSLGNATVTLQVTGFASVGATEGANANADILAPGVNDYASAGAGLPKSTDGFSIDEYTQLLVDNPYPVQVATSVEGTGNATAFVDPHFALGPGVDPSLYQIIYSPNLPAVPEPGTNALIGVGVIVMFFLRIAGVPGCFGRRVA